MLTKGEKKLIFVINDNQQNFWPSELSPHNSFREGCRGKQFWMRHIILMIISEKLVLFRQNILIPYDKLLWCKLNEDEKCGHNVVKNVVTKEMILVLLFYFLGSCTILFHHFFRFKMTIHLIQPQKYLFKHIFFWSSDSPNLWDFSWNPFFSPIFFVK